MSMNKMFKKVLAVVAAGAHDDGNGNANICGRSGQDNGGMDY